MPSWIIKAPQNLATAVGSSIALLRPPVDADFGAGADLDVDFGAGES